MHLSTLYIWLPFCLFLTSCYLPDRHLKRVVEKKEVVGTWEATAHFESLLERYPSTGHRPDQVQIQFLPDASFVFSSVLDDFSSFEYVETRGAWVLKRQPRRHGGEGEENTLVLSFQDERFSSNYSMSFAEEGGRLILWRFFGDPDSWEFIEYQKANAEPERKE